MDCSFEDLSVTGVSRGVIVAEAAGLVVDSDCPVLVFLEGH